MSGITIALLAPPELALLDDELDDEFDDEFDDESDEDDEGDDIVELFEEPLRVELVCSLQPIKRIANTPFFHIVAEYIPARRARRRPTATSSRLAIESLDDLAHWDRSSRRAPSRNP